MNLTFQFDIMEVWSVSFELITGEEPDFSLSCGSSHYTGRWELHLNLMDLNSLLVGIYGLLIMHLTLLRVEMQSRENV